MKKPRFPWYEPQAKDNYIDQQIDNLVTALLGRGAKFFTYGGQQVMYIDGQVIDLFRKNTVLAFLEQINLLPEAYARDTVELLRSQIRPLYRDIPRNTLGTINGIKEPRHAMTRYMHAKVGTWLKQVIESGMLSQTQGV